MNKTTITYFLMALIIIGAFGYMAYGEEAIPSREELRLQARNDLMEEQARIDTHNLMVKLACREESEEKATKASEQIRLQNECFEKDKRPDIDIEKAMEKFSTGTVSTAKSVLPPKELDELFNKVCKSKPSSPICDRATFDRLYKITEERLPGKNFFPILLGITNAESSLGTAFAKNNKGGFCTGYNNLGGVKYKKDDEGKSIRDQKIPQSDGCYLYKFESIDEYWKSKVNTVRYGYKGCINSKTPVDCIGRYYVQGNGLSKPNWNKNVSIFLP